MEHQQPSSLSKRKRATSPDDTDSQQHPATESTEPKRLQLDNPPSIPATDSALTLFNPTPAPDLFPDPTIFNTLFANPSSQLDLDPSLFSLADLSFPLFPPSANDHASSTALVPTTTTPPATTGCCPPLTSPALAALVAHLHTKLHLHFAAIATLLAAHLGAPVTPAGVYSAYILSRPRQELLRAVECKRRRTGRPPERERKRGVEQVWWPGVGARDARQYVLKYLEREAGLKQGTGWVGGEYGVVQGRGEGFWTWVAGRMGEGVGMRG